MEIFGQMVPSESSEYFRPNIYTCSVTKYRFGDYCHFKHAKINHEKRLLKAEIEAIYGDLLGMDYEDRKAVLDLLDYMKWRWNGKYRPFS